MENTLGFLAKAFENVILYDALGNPSFFVRIPKMKSSELDASLPDHTHPAFIINGEEQDAILIGKYKAGEMEGVEGLYSYPGIAAARHIESVDEALAKMRAVNPTVSGLTAADWGLIQLLARKRGWTPGGNTHDGGDGWEQGAAAWQVSGYYNVGTKVIYKGVLYSVLKKATSYAESAYLPDEAPEWYQAIRPVSGDICESVAHYDATLGTLRKQTTFHTNGTGPMSWRMDDTPGGLADIMGNGVEFTWGYRVMKGEIQIMENNDAASPYADLSENSAMWRAILPGDSEEDYTLVDPGTAGTLHWNNNGYLCLDTETTASIASYDTPFSQLRANTAHIAHVPCILRELGLMPLTSDTDAMPGREESIARFYLDLPYYPWRGFAPGMPNQAVRKHWLNSIYYGENKGVIDESSMRSTANPGSYGYANFNITMNGNLCYRPRAIE